MLTTTVTNKKIKWKSNFITRSYMQDNMQKNISFTNTNYRIISKHKKATWPFQGGAPLCSFFCPCMFVLLLLLCGSVCVCWSCVPLGSRLLFRNVAFDVRYSSLFLAIQTRKLFKHKWLFGKFSYVACPGI